MIATTLLILLLIAVAMLALCMYSSVKASDRYEARRKEDLDKIHMDTIKQNIERREKELARQKELDAKAKEIELEKNSRIDSAGTVPGSIDVLSDLSARGRDRVQRSSTTGD